jgi:transposase
VTAGEVDAAARGVIERSVRPQALNHRVGYQTGAPWAERGNISLEPGAKAAVLLGVTGIGPVFATILCTEGLCRHFDSGRQIASYAGLAPSPWQSGNVNCEHGVSKAENPRLRATMVELAWLCLRDQPKSR